MQCLKKKIAYILSLSLIITSVVIFDTSNVHADIESIDYIAKWENEDLIVYQMPHTYYGISTFSDMSFNTDFPLSVKVVNKHVGKQYEIRHILRFIVRPPTNFDTTCLMNLNTYNHKYNLIDEVYFNTETMYAVDYNWQVVQSGRGNSRDRRDLSTFKKEDYISLELIYNEVGSSDTKQFIIPKMEYRVLLGDTGLKIDGNKINVNGKYSCTCTSSNVSYANVSPEYYTVTFINCATGEKEEKILNYNVTTEKHANGREIIYYTCVNDTTHPKKYGCYYVLIGNGVTSLDQLYKAKGLIYCYYPDIKRVESIKVYQDNGIVGMTLHDPVYTKIRDIAGYDVEYTGILDNDGSGYLSKEKPTEAGRYTVTVLQDKEGVRYKGSADFVISPGEILNDCEIEKVNTLYYTGDSQKQKIKVTYRNKDVTNYFDITGDTATNVGDYILNIKYKDSSLSGSKNVSYSIEKKQVTPAVRGFNEEFIYTGLDIIPDLNLVDPDTNKKLKVSDYTVEYNNNRNAGIASYKIKAKPNGNYEFDTISGTFNIGKAKVNWSNVRVELPVKVHIDTLLDRIKLTGQRVISTVNGTLKLIEGQALSLGIHTYNWIFESEDDNYANESGTVMINVHKKVPNVNVNDIVSTFDDKDLSTDKIKGNTDVLGSFTWNDEIPKNVCKKKYKVVFTPTNTEQYETVEKEINVTINKALPTGAPLFDEITFIDKKLSDVNLRVGAISTAGTITFDANEDTVVEKGKSYDWTFTPTDTENYLTLKGNVIPFDHIVKKTPVVTVNAINTVYNGSGVPNSKITGTAMIDSSVIDGTYDWKDSAPITVANSGTYKVVFTPSNTELYNTVEADCAVTITKATPVGIPSFVEITEEDLTLKDTEISVGTINTAGTVSWKLPETTKVIKSTAYEWKFVPTDSANYNMLEGSLTPCTVITPKKVPVLVMQSINTAYDGNPIPVTEIKGKATYDGNVITGKFKWKNTAPINKSDSGVHEVIFTPSDTRHYEVVTGNVNVTISKNKITGKPEITPITTGGKTLRDANLRRGTLTPFNGTLMWDISELSAVAQATEYHWTYTPTDLDNYDIVKGAIVVWKGVPNLTLPDIKLTYNGKAVPESVIAYVAKVGDTLVPGNITWKNGSPTNVSESGEYDVIFTPNDLEKYSKVEGKVKVTIEKAKTNGKPKVTEINKPGMTLADAKLLKGTLPEDGTLTWDKPLNTKVEKATTYTWTYTPNNPNYETLTGTIIVYPEPVQVSNSSGSSGFRKVTYNDEDTSNKRAKELAKKVKELETPKNKDEEKIIADAKAELKLSNAKASSINKELELLAKQVSKTDKEQGKLIEKLIDNNVPASKKKSALNKISERAKEDIAKTVLNQYSDVKPNEWYSKDLSMLIGMDLLRGTSGSTIDPNKNITGKELVAMLVRAKDANITPVAGPRWFELYKDEAKTMKLLDGIKLDLNKDLSRAEVTRLVHNYVATVDKKDANKVNVKSLDKVVDSKDIPKEYLKDVAYLYDRDIFVGYEDSSFRPNQNISRLETAIVVSKLLKY